MTFGATATSAVAVAATTTCPADGCVYIVKGTNSAFNQVPDSAYPQFAYTYDKAVGAPAPQPVTTPYPYFIVPYPATFWPITPPGYLFSRTFDQSVAAGVASLEQLRPVSGGSPSDVLWGYSQGATVVTQYKRDYNAQPSPPATPPSFVLVANPNRPNGGILERGVAFGTIPIVGVTFSGPTPTTTAGAPAGAITTYDIARQYDGIADAPENPLNVLADANAAMGFYYLHGRYVDIKPADSSLIAKGTYGDTHYYLIPTYPLPLLMPLESIPAIGYPLADTLDPALRVIVESAYNRSSSPGQPTPANPLYFPNPATFGTSLLVAIPTGLDNGISDFTGTRPLGTTRPGAYGVGGPTTPPPTPTPVSPTVPLVMSSPGSGFTFLNIPLNTLATFTQLATVLNGGQPGSTATFLDALGAITQAGSTAPQITSTVTNLAPAADGSIGSPTNTAVENVAPVSNQPIRSLQLPAPQSGPNADTTTGSAGIAPPSPNKPDVTNSRPLRSLSRPSLSFAPSGQDASSTNATKPGVPSLVGSTVSNVTHSITSTLGKLSQPATK